MTQLYDSSSFSNSGATRTAYDRKGVRQVIRAIPDKSKDIGFQVLYLLHYKKPPPLVVCDSMREACDVLESLGSREGP